MKTILFTLLATLIFVNSFAQIPDKEGSLVKWLSFKEAFELNKKQPKPFLIDVYTDWCGWCKHMMKTTYAQPELASYINAYFYPVKFDAESKDTVEYLGMKYFNPPVAGATRKTTHQLAYKLLGKNLSYPSTIFSNNNFQFNLLSAGYLEVKKIEPLLIFTLENIFRTTSYEDFDKYYDKAFNTAIADTTPKIKWHSLNEALELNKKKPKKLLINIYTNWCNGCRVMNKSTFPDPKLAAVLEKNFYLVDLNAETKDTIMFVGQTFINNGGNGVPFHPFVMALLKGNVTLPTNVVMNESNQVVDAIPFYLTPETLDPILHFYGDDVYKSLKWDEFKKKYDSKEQGLK